MANPENVYYSLMAYSHSRTRLTVRNPLPRVSPGLICGYSYTMQKVHTVHKRGQIPVMKWLLWPFLGQGPIPGRGPIPVSMFVNEPLHILFLLKGGDASIRVTTLAW